MAIIEHEAESIEDVVRVVLEIHGELGEGAFLWYRGHESHEYDLLPKIMRDGKTSDQVFDREARLLTRFRQRSIAYWPAGYPQNDWEQMFAMQHYGAPTRLLDWTENLFVAVYFALTVVDNNNIKETDIPTLWCIDPVGWNRSSPSLSDYGDTIGILTTADEDLEGYSPQTKKRRSKSPVAMFGTHNSSRIVAQRGTFMVWGEEVRRLESFAEDAAIVRDIHRISMTGDKSTLKKDIQTLGFGETMIFPELAYLATELSRTEGWRN